MKLKTRIAASLALLSLASWSGAAQAEIGCTFKVNQVSIEPNGTVSLQLTDNSSIITWFFCAFSGSINVTTGYGPVTITSDTCRGYYSQFLTARAQNQPLTFWFVSAPNCNASSLPASWTTPNPYPYIIIF